MNNHINHLFPIYMIGAIVFSIALFVMDPINVKAGFDIVPFGDFKFELAKYNDAIPVSTHTYKTLCGAISLTNISRNSDLMSCDEFILQIPVPHVYDFDNGFTYPVSFLSLEFTDNFSSFSATINTSYYYSTVITLDRAQTAALRSFSEQDHVACRVFAYYSVYDFVPDKVRFSLDDTLTDTVNFYGIRYTYDVTDSNGLTFNQFQQLFNNQTTSLNNNVNTQFEQSNNNINNVRDSIDNGFSQEHSDSLKIQDDLLNSTSVTNENMSNVNDNLSTSLNGLNDAEAQVYDVAISDLKEFDPNDTFNLVLGAYTVELATLGGWMDKIINNSDGLSIVAVLLIFLALIGLVLSLDLRKGD